MLKMRYVKCFKKIRNYKCSKNKGLKYRNVK